MEEKEQRTVDQLTENQLKNLVVESVYDALIRIGIDTTNPTEMQKDFQHLRDWRVATHEVQKKSLLVIVGILVSGICAATWLGFKAILLTPISSNRPPV